VQGPWAVLACEASGERDVLLLLLLLLLLL
jgi:hypothetical protein